MKKISVSGFVLVALLFCAPAPIWAQQNQDEDCAVGVVGNIALNMRRQEISVEIGSIGSALSRFNLPCLRGIIGRVGIGLGIPNPFANLGGAICNAVGL